MGRAPPWHLPGARDCRGCPLCSHTPRSFTSHAWEEGTCGNLLLQRNVVWVNLVRVLSKEETICSLSVRSQRRQGNDQRLLKKHSQLAPLLDFVLLFLHPWTRSLHFPFCSRTWVEYLWCRKGYPMTCLSTSEVLNA